MSNASLPPLIEYESDEEYAQYLGCGVDEIPTVVGETEMEAGESQGGESCEWGEGDRLALHLCEPDEVSALLRFLVDSEDEDEIAEYLDTTPEKVRRMLVSGIEKSAHPTHWARQFIQDFT